MPTPLKELTLAMVPGTGRMGSNLARLYAQAGYKVWIGSRDADKARMLARELREQFSDQKLQLEAGTNQEAAEQADVVFWCISGSLDERRMALRSLQEQLRGKLIVDVTNVLYFYDESHWGQVSSTLLSKEALGAPAHWTCAWKSTFWKLLEEPPTSPLCTFVCGDDPQSVATTMALVEEIKPFKAVNAGGLKNTKIVELLGPRFIVELDKLNCQGQMRSTWQFGL